MLKAISILTLSAALFSCASMPRMERKISIWNGCPEQDGICRLDLPAVQAKAQALGASQAIQDWIVVNIDGRKVDVIPAKGEAFKKYAGISFDDLGVILKYIDSLQRKITGQ